MRASFPKHTGGGRVAVFEWSDGLIATTPIHGRATTLPHDLEHYVVEARLRFPYGFWTLAAQQAPFDSLTLVRGRWPKGKQEWFARLRRKHGVEMLKAEATGVKGLDSPTFDVEAAWPSIRRAMRRSYAFNPQTELLQVTRADITALHHDALRLHEAWRSVPTGGALVVQWPPKELEILTSSHRGG